MSNCNNRMKKNLRISILIGSILLLSFSFIEEKRNFLNFSNEKNLQQTMEYLGDSIYVIKNLGSNYTVGLRNRCMRTSVGSKLIKTNSYYYPKLGLTISYSTTSNVTPNEDFSGVETLSQYDNILVDLDSTSEIRVYGYKLNESKFGELTRDSVTGKWAEMINDDGHFFSYVSRYVSFNSGLFTQERIDSLHLDYEKTEEMNKFFEDKRMNSIQIRNTDSFYNR
jgi:hypothetical protein